jgi:RNA polymerase sigma factor (sigma-70 family)
MSKRLKCDCRAELEERLLVHSDELRAHVVAKIPPRFRRRIDVDDILQETWATVFHAITDFVPTGSDGLIRWLKTVANRRILDAIRDTRGGKHDGPAAALREADRHRDSFDGLLANLLASDDTPSRDAAKKEATQALQFVLSVLPDDRQTAIRLRYVDGRWPREIARTMHKTVPAVRSLIFNGMRQLAAEFDDIGDYLSGDHSRKDKDLR